MLRGQDFGGREHGHLVAVLDGDDGGFRGNDGLAAAHVALQQTVHGARLAHVVHNLLDDALLRLGGLERQHGLDALAHLVGDFESDAGQRPGLRAFERDAALEPEELFEDQAELRRGAECVEKAEVGIGGREVRFANGGGAVRQLQAAAKILGQEILLGLERLEDAVRERANHARRELAGGFIDGDEAAGVERGFAVLVVARQGFELGVQHGELARIAVELHLAEEREFHAFGEHIGKVAAVEPFTHQDGPRGVREARFEEAEAAPLEAGSLGRTHLYDHGGHFARRQLGDRFHVAPVLVAEGHVAEQVLDGDQALGFEHGCPPRADAFDVSKRGGELHRG